MASVLVLALAAVMSWNSAVAGEPHETGFHDQAHETGSPDSAMDRATLEQEKAYSLLMRRSSGLALLAVGGLLLADRLTRHRYRVARITRGIAWMLLGVHILLNADPAHWPMGAGFVESFSIPSPNETNGCSTRSWPCSRWVSGSTRSSHARADPAAMLCHGRAPRAGGHRAVVP